MRIGHIDSKGIAYRLITTAARHDRSIRIVSATVAAVCTVLFAIVLYQLGQISSTPNDSGTNSEILKSLRIGLIFVALVTGALQVLAYILTMALPRGEAETAKHVVDLDEALSHYEVIMENSIQFDRSLSESIAALNAILARRDPSDDTEEWKKDIGSILLPFFQEEDARQRIFGYASSSIYNVVVYIHDEKTNTLKSIWRYNHSRFQELKKGLGRDWPSGHGQVGLCHKERKILVASDLRPLGHMDDHGRELYASSVAIPILSAEESVCGVCAVTSNVPSQFANYDLDGGTVDWTEKRMVFESIGRLLSVYMAYTHQAMEGKRHE